MHVRLGFWTDNAVRNLTFNVHWVFRFTTTTTIQVCCAILLASGVALHEMTHQLLFLAYKTLDAQQHFELKGIKLEASI